MRMLAQLALACAFACGKKSSPPTPAPSAESATPVTGGAVADADQVIARLRPAFRRCYDVGLRVDPQMAGRVVFNVAVDGSGAVAAVAVQTKTGNLSEPVVACITLAIRKATFAPPAHAAMLAIPVSFVQQGTEALSEEEVGVKNAVTTACARSLRKRGAVTEDVISKQCECSWGILRRTLSVTEINDAKMVDDPRFLAAKAEAARVCVPTQE